LAIFPLHQLRLVLIHSVTSTASLLIRSAQHNRGQILEEAPRQCARNTVKIRGSGSDAR
jgi:hypothetical protein